MNKWEKPAFSKKQIQKAGTIIAKAFEEEKTSNEYMNALSIVDNWRASHAYPMNILYRFLQRTVESKEGYTVVQRLKRLESIVGKLKRFPQMSLYRMEDLGGCRVIVPTVDDIYNLVSKIKRSQIRHRIVQEHDYIKNPKESGYRSYHIVFQYYSDKNPTYNGMRIEVQIRTKLEHQWATAIEIMGSVTGESLKSSFGHSDHLRFFSLVASEFAIEELCPLVPGTPVCREEIAFEINQIDKKAKIREKLSAYNAAIRYTGEYPDEAAYYILIIDLKRHQLSSRIFKRNEIVLATEQYQELEKIKGVSNYFDVVLVSAESFSEIREGYQNYFSSTQEFSNRLNKLLHDFSEKSNLKFVPYCEAQRVVEKFSITPLKNNYESTNRFDGIGKANGNLIVCPPWPRRLEDSYLRYTGIINGLISKEQAGMRGCYPVSGPGIILSQSGASFYIKKENWYYLCEENSLLIQAKSKNQISDLLILIAWLKSDILAWHLLWNLQTESEFSPTVFKEIRFPALDGTQRKNVVQKVNNIIKSEIEFVKSFRKKGNKRRSDTETDEMNKFIDDYNDSVLNDLVGIENIFQESLALDNDAIDIIKKELLTKGMYSYRNAEELLRQREDEETVIELNKMNAE